jgi:hypothetical protein
MQAASWRNCPIFRDSKYPVTVPGVPESIQALK